jgi:hypothetical protein
MVLSMALLGTHEFNKIANKRKNNFSITAYLAHQTKLSVHATIGR